MKLKNKNMAQAAVVCNRIKEKVVGGGGIVHLRYEINDKQQKQPQKERPHNQDLTLQNGRRPTTIAASLGKWKSISGVV